MPLQYKIILTAIVVAVGGVVAFVEFGGAQSYLGWVVLTIVAIMILGQWVFPEAGSKDKKV